MDKYKETANTWNKIASLYRDQFMDLDLYNHTYDFFLQAISKREAKILEIGCGPGNITKYLLSKRPDLGILGIDVAPNMVKLAKEHNPTAHFAVMDSREAGSLKSPFDGIVCGFCLPYLSPVDCMKLLADCHALLSGEGLLYLSFVEGDPIQSGFQVGSSGDRVYLYYHSLTDILKQLHKLGFHEVHTFEVPYPRLNKLTEIHTIVTARKRGQFTA